MGSWFDGVYPEFIEGLTMKTDLKLAEIPRSSPWSGDEG